MMKGSRKSPRNSSPVNTSSAPQPSYPLAAYLDFVPGGVDYGNKGTTLDPNVNRHSLSYLGPDAIVRKALAADDTLRKYALRYHALGNDDPDDLPHRLPSLSVLAEASFAPSTGVHASASRPARSARIAIRSRQNPARWAGYRHPAFCSIPVVSKLPR